MSKPMATVIPIRAARARKPDLALALAMLGKSVKAHDRVRRAKLALFVRSSFRRLGTYAGANPLGA